MNDELEDDNPTVPQAPAGSRGSRLPRMIDAPANAILACIYERQGEQQEEEAKHRRWQRENAMHQAKLALGLLGGIALALLIVASGIFTFVLALIYQGW